MAKQSTLSLLNRSTVDYELNSSARRENETSLSALSLRLTGHSGAKISGIAGSLSCVIGEVFKTKAAVGGSGLAVALKPKAEISM